MAAIHSGTVLGHEDTREQMRTWMIANIPEGTNVVVEPFIPQGFLTTGGRDDGERFHRFPIRRPFQTYETRLSPGLVDEYRSGGYCWVVTGSHQRDRGLAAGLDEAREYYQRIERESDLRAVFSPYKPGASPVAFNFDTSFNYLPRQYTRPGPLIQIYRLKDCAA